MDAANKISANQLDINRITSPAIVNALSSAGTLGTTMTGQQAANIAKQGELGLGVAQQQGTNLSNAGQLGLSESGQQINALGTAGDLSTRQGQLQLAAAQGDIGAQQAVQQGRLAGLSGLSSNQTNAGQLSLGQAGLLSDNARSVLGAQGNLAGLTSSNVGNLQSMIQQGRQYGTSGLSNLYQSTTNQLSDADRNQLTAMGLSNDQIAKLLEIQQKGAGMAGSNQQMFGNIMSGVGTAAMFL
jgi:hypothetical protein